MSRVEKIEKIIIQHFEVEIHYKKIKNIYLKVKQGGKIMVSAPVNIKESYIIKFVESRSDWIMETQQKIMGKEQPLPELKEDEILLFGKPYKGDLSVAELRKLLHEKIMIYYKKYLPILKKEHCFNVPTEIKYRTMNSTWGVCRPKAGIITFNRRLVHQPVEFIEYVVLHEMCHLVIPNHCKLFYELFEIVMPHFREYEKMKIVYK